ncbi:MAG: SdpI family protein [Lachnospiraceae bacterium]|nr:SdpI family protein [Lachnospiraceae bacterium]
MKHEKINNTAMLILSSIVCLLPLILSALVYSDLPEQIAIQWSSTGEAVNYVPKAVAAFGLPLVFTAANLISKIRLMNDPKRESASSAMRKIYMWLIPSISLILIPVALFIALGVNIPITVIAPVIIGIAFILFGNYLPKNRQNYVIGVKLPWTLNNADNWNKTHRMAGYLWILGGIALISGSFFTYQSSAWLIISAIVLVSVIILPFIYSFLLYKMSWEK